MLSLNTNEIKIPPFSEKKTCLRIQKSAYLHNQKI